MITTIKKWYNRNYANGNYLYIIAKSPYVKGIVGKDIKLTLVQKLQILFAKGISVAFTDESIK